MKRKNDSSDALARLPTPEINVEAWIAKTEETTDPLFSTLDDVQNRQAQLGILENLDNGESRYDSCSSNGVMSSTGPQRLSSQKVTTEGSISLDVEQLESYAVLSSTFTRLEAKNAKFAQTIRDILRSDRFLPITIDMKVDWLDYWGDNKESINKATLLNIVSSILKPDKCPQLSSPGVADSKKQWSAYGVTYRLNQPLHSFPNAKLVDDEKQPISLKSHYIPLKSSQPDMIFGLSETNYKWPRGWRILESGQQLMDIRRLVDGICHGFLLVEGTSARGRDADAHSRLKREGAILLGTERLVREATTGLRNKDGVDEDTFIFSAHMAGTHVEFFVHWAEDDPERSDSLADISYLCAKVAGAEYEDIDGEGLGELYKIFHNILHWGAHTRKPQADKYHEILMARWKPKAIEIEEGSNK